jgi:hypothetical protein
VSHHVSVGEERYAVITLQPDDPAAGRSRLRGFERIDGGREAYPRGAGVALRAALSPAYFVCSPAGTR